MERYGYNQNSNRRLLIIFGVLVVASIGGLYGFRYYRSFRNVTLVSTNGVLVELGTKADPHETSDNSIGSLKAQTSTNTTVRLRNGTYLVKFSESGKQDVYRTINVPETTQIKSPDLDLSQSKLNQLLAATGEAPRSTTLSIVGASNYSVSYEALYKQGDWYAAVLSPKLAGLDRQRVILNKTNGAWKVAASPAIVFYIGDFPKIPEQIIRDINNH